MSKYAELYTTFLLSVWWGFGLTIWRLILVGGKERGNQQKQAKDLQIFS